MIVTHVLITVYIIMITVIDVGSPPISALYTSYDVSALFHVDAKYA